MCNLLISVLLPPFIITSLFVRVKSYGFGLVDYDTGLLEKDELSGNGRSKPADDLFFSLMEMRRVTHSSIAGRHTSE